MISVQASHWPSCNEPQELLVRATRSARSFDSDPEQVAYLQQNILGSPLHRNTRLMARVMHNNVNDHVVLIQIVVTAGVWGMEEERT